MRAAICVPLVVSHGPGTGLDRIEPRGWDSLGREGERLFGGRPPNHEHPFGVKGFLERVFAPNA
jgi:hypothetical protein